MGFITGFIAFWYDFIVGDDWTVAAGVIIALGITALAVQSGVSAWPLLPLVIAVSLGWYAWRIAKSTDHV
jgi:hypothetical protein